MRGEFPMAAPPDDKAAAGVLALLSFVDGKQLEARFGFDFRRGARDQLERNPIEGQRQFVSSNAFFLSERIGANERGISFDIGKSAVAHKNAAKFGLDADELVEAEFVALLVLREENGPWIDAEKVLSIPFAVIVVFAGQSDFVPGGITIVYQKIQFEVNVGAIGSDALPRIGGAPHHGDDVAGFDRLPDFEAGADLLQMGVEGVNLQTIDLMTKDDVDTIVGERRVNINVDDTAIGSGHHRIDRFAVLVALQATNVQAFVDLPAVGAHTTEGAAGPGFAGRWNEEFFFLARFVDGAVWSGKEEDAGANRCAKVQSINE